jgi:hypothetical protein
MPLRSFLAREGLLVFSVCATLAVLLGFASAGSSDMWLAIAAGQSITTHGLPRIDHLTQWTQGKTWVDQQWLAQILIAKLFSLGGTRAVVLICDGFAAAAFAGAAATARNRGASSRATLWVAIAALAALAPFAGNPRTQSLSYLPFVTIVVLVSRDSRRPSRLILASLPLLVIWANLHGSVLLGALIVSVHGLLSVRKRTLGVALALIGAPWVCVLASPYAAHLPGYYLSTVASSNFSRYVQEWQPTHLSAITAAFYLLAAGALYLAGRCRREFTFSEGAILLVAGIAGAHAMRNIVWFALAALVLLPAPLTVITNGREYTLRLNRVGGLMGLAVAAAMVTVSAMNGDLGRGHYQTAAADTAYANASGEGRVFATEIYSDWLLVEHPTLTSRVAYDARLELLSAADVKSLSALISRGDDWRRLTNGYSTFVLDRRSNSELVAKLQSAAAARTIYEDKNTIVLTRN